ncbi:sodium:solute symporter [Duganella sp. FT50W]|uniref:Sodium:solute symporter n=1 Tax=Duganella lactea TaxID=2692173 RepID=A0A6L8MM29_9BURK|nr:sodium:solute symporter [Duganella lactea]MYM36318.1 sodium:solute symporter [Duganella lactea]MYM81535.1 sodium:solute symporter [Duganella lactea]
MSAVSLFSLISAYFALLLIVAWRTSRNANNDSFFIGNKNSNWLLVAFGMVGTTMSGVTFISVPGAIGRDGFGYLQVILGYVLGYIAVIAVLLPLYYRLKLTSIYTYLARRLGPRSYQSGAAFFILSRTLSASARLYLVVNILQMTILDSMGVPFWLSTVVILAMILLYTYEGGVKTIVWTDTLQTAGMVLSLVICTGWLLHAMDLGPLASLARMHEQNLTRVLTTAIDSPANVWKQVGAGFFIVLAMTGMDQETMQKNISVKTLRDAQKNMALMTIVLTVVLVLFMYLGGLLYLYAPAAGVTAVGDKIFPAVVMGHMPAALQLIFFIGLISALFPSADGAMTALTSSFSIDILGVQRRTDLTEAAKTRLRHRVHLAFCAIFLALVLLFKWVDNASMVGLVLKLTGYTYGPLLGLFAFGILTRRAVRDRWVPVVALAGPVLCYVIDFNQEVLFGSYRIGLELLILNGLIVFTGLMLVSKKQQ